MVNAAVPHATRETLIVEGDAASRELEQITLSSAGFQVTALAGGAPALRLATAKRFDLIVLDVTLDDMDGLEVCRRLRADDTNDATPILMLSSHSAAADAVAALEAGADDCLIKPFAARELVARAGALL